MSRATLILSDGLSRQKAADWIDRAPKGTRVTFNASKRSVPQNDRMWAMLTEIATQLKWHGMTLKADQWKIIFMDGLNQEVQPVPNLNNNGFVNLGRSSSSLSKEEMSDLMELMAAFGAKHDVKFQEAA